MKRGHVSGGMQFSETPRSASCYPGNTDLVALSEKISFLQLSLLMQNM